MADLKELNRLCQQGRLYEVERWIQDGRPIQASSEIEARGRCQSALEIALKTGQHSLCLLLLRSGFRVDLEHDLPLDIALQERRWDLVDLLFEYGADPHEADLEIVFDTYQTSIFERFRSAGVDLAKGHALAGALAYHTRNKPLYGFVKRSRQQVAGVQNELDIALGYHVGADKEKGIALCLWAGADPHAPARDLEYGSDEDPEEEHWTAIRGAVYRGNVKALRKFSPNPSRLDFDELYQLARDREVVEFLAGIRQPRDLTQIVRRMSFAAGATWCHRRDWKEPLLAVLGLGVRWEHAAKDVLAGIRRDLLRASDWDLKDVLRVLGRPEVCSPEIYQELTRTATMQKRLLAMKLIRPPVKPISQAAKRRDEVSSLLRRYDRERLYEEVWAQPVIQAAKSYRVSGVYLARVCRALRVPVPPRGYWARLRSGQTVRRPPLRNLPKNLAEIEAAGRARSPDV